MRVTTARRRAASLIVAVLVGATTLAACDLPQGFRSYTVFQGLNKPTNVEFAPDGRVFVAEQRGVIKVFDGLDDATPSVFADLRTRVYHGWDRGLLGLAFAPDFSTDPAVYVLYTLDQMPGGTVPEWGQAFTDVDNCPSPPGYTDDGCVVMGRLSKLPLNAAGAWSGEEIVLVDDWCQQFPTHSIGTIAFGPDGSLYAGGGDGADFLAIDYGQHGIPRNPCGDPPVGVGGTMVPQTAEGGMLRSQDVRTLGDPTSPDGSIIRVDPDTGAPMPGNPLIGSPNTGARRIVATGLRNPFRFTLRPGTSELWIADVGWGWYEEIDRSVGNDATLDNFGWPCYEGPDRVAGYDELDNTICEGLYAQGSAGAKPAVFTYQHRQKLTPNEPCDETVGAVIAGVAFQPAGSQFPPAWDGSLFFADAFRRCIWRLAPGANGLPDPSKLTLFASKTGTIVDLQFGPGGDLWYADIEGGTIRRIGFSATNHPPAAVLAAQPTSGNPPLTVTFDAGASSDVDPGDELAFTWDVDGDGQFDDGTGPTITQTYTTAGVKVVRVKVTDKAGAAATAEASVTVGAPGTPVPVMASPAAGATTTVGTSLAFSGSATADGAPVPASDLRWQVDQLHCPDACHRHANVYAVEGVASGSFVVPDHEYPTGLEVTLHATGPTGQTASVTRRVDLASTKVDIDSRPAGAPITIGSTSGVTPMTTRQSTGGRTTLIAPLTTTIGGVPHTFVRWSDGGAATHDITVPTTATTYKAFYEPA